MYILQEEDIAFIKQQIQMLQNSIANNSSVKMSDEEFEKLQQENIKLKHRVALLKRVILEILKTCQRTVFIANIFSFFVIISLYLGCRNIKCYINEYAKQ